MQPMNIWSLGNCRLQKVKQVESIMHHLFGCWLSCALIWWGNNVKHRFIHIYKRLPVCKRRHACILFLDWADTPAPAWHAGRLDRHLQRPTCVRNQWTGDSAEQNHDMAEWLPAMLVLQRGSVAEKDATFTLLCCFQNLMGDASEV